MHGGSFRIVRALARRCLRFCFFLLVFGTFIFRSRIEVGRFVCCKRATGHGSTVESPNMNHDPERLGLGFWV